MARYCRNCGREAGPRIELCLGCGMRRPFDDEDPLDDAETLQQHFEFSFNDKRFLKSLRIAPE